MSRRGRPPHPDVLTPRQQEVLRLVREGLTNEQIAGRLGISHDGAKFHVSEILSRLGVTTRTEAARWEREQPAERPSASLAHRRRRGWGLPTRRRALLQPPERGFTARASRPGSRVHTAGRIPERRRRGAFVRLPAGAHAA